MAQFEQERFVQLCVAVSVAGPRHRVFDRHGGSRDYRLTRVVGTHKLHRTAASNA